MVEQLDVGFGVDGNVTLCGWLFVPDGRGPRPAITMAHGYAGIREHGVDRFARVFADAGFVVPIKPGPVFGHRAVPRRRSRSHAAPERPFRHRDIEFPAPARLSHPLCMRQL